MRQFSRGTLAVLAGLSVFGSASAETDRPKYIGGEVQAFFPDSNRDADTGWGTRGLFGIPLSDKLDLELGVNSYRYDRESDNGTESAIGGESVLRYHVGPGSEHFQPFLLGGIGGLRESIRNDDEWAFTGQVGLGADFPLTRSLALRTDARYQMVFNDLAGNDDPYGDFTVGIGLVGYFASKKVEEAPAPTGPIDSDGDGVPDDADLCPGTAPGVEVDDKGCPKEMPKPAVSGNRKYEDVHFAFDKSNLDSAATMSLDSTAKTITELTNTYPDLKVEVSGHTDWIGTDGYNMGLSERRATAVKDYLVRQGVSATRISTFAFGESKPIATNETEEGRAMNRRAEVVSKEQ